MRGLNVKEIMSKSNLNQQGLNIATYGQPYLIFFILKQSALLCTVYSIM